MKDIIQEGAEADLRQNSVTVERRTSARGEELTLRLNRLPLGPTTYEVAGLGSLGVDLVSLGDSSAQQVTLDCTGCPELQGSRQKVMRTISVANGYGSQMIAPDRVLRIDTGVHREKGSGKMRPVWRDNRSLGGPYDDTRKVWIKAEEVYE